MKKAFTLVEMLVVIGMFSLILGAVSGLFILGISTQRRILASQEMLGEISFALEYMVRSLRMAKKDDIEINLITKNCLLANKANYEVSNGEIRFRNYRNECQRFYLENEKILEQKNYDLAGQPLPLTSDKIKIKSLKFNTIGQFENDSLQPRVTIFVEVEGQSTHQKIQIQTTISQRDLDVSQ